MINKLFILLVYDRFFKYWRIAANVVGLKIEYSGEDPPDRFEYAGSIFADMSQTLTTSTNRDVDRFLKSFNKERLPALALGSRVTRGLKFFVFLYKWPS